MSMVPFYFWYLNRNKNHYGYSSDINPIPFLNDNITVYCVIDGAKYKVTWSKNKGENCTLTPVA